MKTIEERAKKLYPQETMCDGGAHERGYIRGAITQKLIDIEKACAAYCKVCGHRKEIALPQDCRKDCLRFEAFLKAMKE